MGTTAPQQDSGTQQPLEPSETRSAILTAARQVALRDGVLDMSLATVAQEAGCAPNEIYALYSSKDDLLLSVIADDLTTLAQAMRSGVPLSEACRHADETETEQVASEPGATDLHADDEPQFVSRFPVVQPRRDYQRAMEVAQAEAAETKEAVAKLQETVSRLEARPVDSWLERRLRELEHSLETLEDKHAKQTNSDTLFEERCRELGQSIQELEERGKVAAEDAIHSLAHRLDASEKRLLELVSNVEADSSGHARRLTALENAATTSAPDFPDLSVAVSSADSDAARPEETKSPPAAESSRLSSSASYLAAARRSAQASAVASEPVTPSKPKQKTNPLMLYLAGGSFVLFVALIGGMHLLLRNTATETAPLKARPPAAVVARRETAKIAPHAAVDSRQLKLRELASSGNPSAELLVGLEYLDGNGLPNNDSAAIAWLTRAAAKGQAVAEYNVGTMWSEGRGVHADSVQAFQWLGSAALRGNRRAMHSLAVAYAQGLGTTKNLSEAARWFERAAMLGSVNSQFDLAVLYERGMGVPQNLSTAYKWYAIAAAQGDRESQARVTALASTLLPRDLESAKVAALSFRPEPMDESANVPPKLSDLP